MTEDPAAHGELTEYSVALNYHISRQRLYRVLARSREDAAVIACRLFEQVVDEHPRPEELRNFTRVLDGPARPAAPPAADLAAQVRVLAAVGEA